MELVDFELRHAAEAACLAEKQMNLERQLVELPEAAVPSLQSLANGLSVAALEGNRLLGFLGAYGPFVGMFGTHCEPEGSRFVGVISPVHCHAVAADAPRYTWQRLYQAAAEKWVKAGAAYHAIALCEHDEMAKRAFFRYGFGQRCADAIRRVEPIGAAKVSGITLGELPKGDAARVRDMRIRLDTHLSNSPTFQVRSEKRCTAWLERAERFGSRLFVAQLAGEPVAFIEVCDEGENFITEHPDMLNICGAYCMEALRGQGVSQMLLDHVLQILQAEGVRYLGVDYESMNPTAVGFWEKNFQPYTASVVRKVDCL